MRAVACCVVVQMLWAAGALAADGPVAVSVRRHAEALAAAMTYDDQRATAVKPCRHRALKGAVVGVAAGVALGLTLPYALRDCGTCSSARVKPAMLFGVVGAAAGSTIGALADRGCEPSFSPAVAER